MSSLLIASALTAICAIWMVARIWRSSPGMAVVSFLFFPAAVIPLVQNWGEEDDDIKVPFALTVASLAFLYFSLHKAARVVVDQQQSFNWLSQYFA